MSARVITNINDNWFFRLNDDDSYRGVLFDHSDWERVNIPHDWSPGLGLTREAPSGPRGGFAQAGTGWYRRMIHTGSVGNNRRVIVRFDGVFMNSRVYLNGELMGYRPYGYSSFAYDLTDSLMPGANVLAVRVDCRNQPASRWYNGCGIYRPVELIETGDLCTALDGTFITTPDITPRRAQIHCRFNLENHGSVNEKAEVVHTILDKSGNVRCRVSQNLDIPLKGLTAEVSLAVDKPELWSCEDPHLYTHVIEIGQHGDIKDRYETVFGIRKLEFIPQKGFFLNGRFTKLKGVCLHHDAGVVGAAVPEGLLRKRLNQLRKMGCNGIRTAHNPFSSRFYELCDELGLMVMDEIFDGWEETKADNDYGLLFEEWADRDLHDWVVRDRNHPSVIMWSLGNEVHNMKPETTVRLRDLVKQLDPSRPVTCGVQGTGDLSDANRALLDIAGYNDGGGACFVYDRDHERRPDQLFVATEAPHTFQTRGFYRTQTWWRDQNQPRREIENLTDKELFFDGSLHYHSSYDNAGVRNCVRDSWSDSEKRPYLLGEFRWTGFDYYGESMGWPSRLFPSGVIDTANFEKDHYYLYQSLWTDYKTREPMVHILPHWTHPDLEEGTPVPVWIYTNCPGAELFLNGESLGVQIKGDRKHLSWMVPWTPGVLEGRGLEYDGKVLCRMEHVSVNCPDTLMVEWESLDYDLNQISVTISHKGNPHPRGENSVAFTPLDIRGLHVLGTENGDPTDLINTNSSVRKAFYGKVMALIKEEEKRRYLMVSSLLGQVVFKRETLFTLAAGMVQKPGNTPTVISSLIGDINLFNNETVDKRGRCDLRGTLWAEISLNGGDYQKYTDPLKLDRTTQIRAKIYHEEKLIREQSQLFIRGEKEKIIDLVHGNRVLDLKRTVGPFAAKLAGLWFEGDNLYLFEEKGDFYRILEAEERQHLGSWWYDFPVDYLEVPDYAGQGEIWFNTGEKSSLSLKDQSARTLIIDNSSRAFRTLWSSPPELTFTREIP